MHKYYIEPVVLCETRTDNVTKIHKNLPLTNHPFIVKQDDVISNARNESFVTNLDKFSLSLSFSLILFALEMPRISRCRRGIEFAARELRGIRPVLTPTT